MRGNTMFKTFLIKYGEIGIKGKNRHLFEDALVKQIRHALKKAEGSFQVYKEQGRIYVDCLEPYDFEETVECLRRVFGIVGICPVMKVEDRGLEELGNEVIDFLENVYDIKAQTFKVVTRRAKKSYPVESMEVNSFLGSRILEAFPTLKVDVHDPEILLHVEIREKIYLYSKIIPGPGGMPVGTNGKAMLLLSGGIDSPVAGYKICKRGVKLDAVYFHAPPYTSERAKEKVVDLARILSRYAGPIMLHVVNFTDIQLYIYDKCPHDELTIIMRRYMMKIAEHFAGETNSLALITGESIGQVASQTMQSLAATNEVCTIPVFRPLIGEDKQEIVDVALQIGTYETSILPYEDCCTVFTPRHPRLRPVLGELEAAEAALDVEGLVKAAVDGIERIQV